MEHNVRLSQQHPRNYNESQTFVQIPYIDTRSSPHLICSFLPPSTTSILTWTPGHHPIWSAVSCRRPPPRYLRRHPVITPFDLQFLAVIHHLDTYIDTRSSPHLICSFWPSSTTSILTWTPGHHPIWSAVSCRHPPPRYLRWHSVITPFDLQFLAIHYLDTYMDTRSSPHLICSFLSPSTTSILTWTPGPHPIWSAVSGRHPPPRYLHGHPVITPFDLQFLVTIHHLDTYVDTRSSPHLICSFLSPSTTSILTWTPGHHPIWSAVSCRHPPPRYLHRHPVITPFDLQFLAAIHYLDTYMDTRSSPHLICSFLSPSTTSILTWTPGHHPIWSAVSCHHPPPRYLHGHPVITPFDLQFLAIHHLDTYVDTRSSPHLICSFWPPSTTSIFTWTPGHHPIWSAVSCHHPPPRYLRGHPVITPFDLQFLAAIHHLDTYVDTRSSPHLICSFLSPSTTSILTWTPGHHPIWSAVSCRHPPPRYLRGHPVITPFDLQFLVTIHHLDTYMDTRSSPHLICSFLSPSTTSILIWTPGHHPIWSAVSCHHPPPRYLRGHPVITPFDLQFLAAIHYLDTYVDTRSSPHLICSFLSPSTTSILTWTPGHHPIWSAVSCRHPPPRYLRWHSVITPFDLQFLVAIHHLDTYMDTRSSPHLICSFLSPSTTSILTWTPGHHPIWSAVSCHHPPPRYLHGHPVITPFDLQFLVTIRHLDTYMDTRSSPHLICSFLSPPTTSILTWTPGHHPIWSAVSCRHPPPRYLHGHPVITPFDLQFLAIHHLDTYMDTRSSPHLICSFLSPSTTSILT